MLCLCLLVLVLYSSLGWLCLFQTFAAQKMKFFIKDFLSKYDEIRSFLRIWSHLLKKSLMENFIFCAVVVSFSKSYQKKAYNTCFNKSAKWWTPTYNVIISSDRLTFANTVVSVHQSTYLYICQKRYSAFYFSGNCLFWVDCNPTKLSIEHWFILHKKWSFPVRISSFLWSVYSAHLENDSVLNIITCCGKNASLLKSYETITNISVYYFRSCLFLFSS